MNRLLITILLVLVFAFSLAKFARAQVESGSITLPQTGTPSVDPTSPAPTKTRKSSKARRAADAAPQNSTSATASAPAPVAAPVPPPALEKTTDISLGGDSGKIQATYHMTRDKDCKPLTIDREVKVPGCTTGECTYKLTSIDASTKTISEYTCATTAITSKILDEIKDDTVQEFKDQKKLREKLATYKDEVQEQQDLCEANDSSEAKMGEDGRPHKYVHIYDDPKDKKKLTEDDRKEQAKDLDDEKEVVDDPSSSSLANHFSEKQKCIARKMKDFLASGDTDKARKLAEKASDIYQDLKERVASGDIQPGTLEYKQFLDFKGYMENHVLKDKQLAAMIGNYETKLALTKGDSYHRLMQWLKSNPVMAAQYRTTGALSPSNIRQFQSVLDLADSANSAANISNDALTNLRAHNNLAAVGALIDKNYKSSSGANDGSFLSDFTGKSTTDKSLFDASMEKVRTASDKYKMGALIPADYEKLPTDKIISSINPNRANITPHFGGNSTAYSPNNCGANSLIPQNSVACSVPQAGVGSNGQNLTTGLPLQGSSFNGTQMAANGQRNAANGFNAVGHH